MHGYGYGPVTPGCFTGAPVAPVAHGGYGTGFTLIVVLFILLVIIGAAWVTPAV